jgi:hypothetical protein
VEQVRVETIDVAGALAAAHARVALPPPSPVIDITPISVEPSPARAPTMADVSGD